MKRVLGLSLGSVRRDHTVKTEILGHPFEITRRGTDGDFQRYLQEFRDHDGKVDAFGVGGIEFYVNIDGRRYHFRQARKIRRLVRKSKLADGNGIKHFLGVLAVQTLQEQGVVLAGRKAMKTNGMDRWGLACALVEAGCEVTFGDLLFTAGLPFPFKNLSQLKRAAKFSLPWATQVPFQFWYRMGAQQDVQAKNSFHRYLEKVEVIAGDFIQIWSHLPEKLDGKIIITNTTTTENVEELRRRGLDILVTTTPRLGGRSFGTNIIEAICRTLVDKPDPDITEEDLREVLCRAQLLPQLHRLQ